MKNQLRLPGLILSMCLLNTACALKDSNETRQQNAQERGTGLTMQVVDIKASDRVQARHNDDAERVVAPAQPQSYSGSSNAYKGNPLPRHVGDYVQNMAQDLIGNMDFVTDRTPIAVTHFALLDSDLQQTNLLGKQMAESFVHEMHKFRIPVVDFKAADYIRVTEQGDFLLSRDYLELDQTLPVEYVLTGTMTRHQGGVLVNARMLGLDSRTVVATAQMLIPYYVVDALIPSDGSQKNGVSSGVKLSRG